MTGKKIVWASGLILDFSLSKTTQFEILKNLSKSGYHTLLFGMRSKKSFRSRTTKDNSDQDLLVFPAFSLFQ